MTEIEKEGLALVRIVRQKLAVTREIVGTVQAWRAENSPVALSEASRGIVAGGEQAKVSPRNSKYKPRVGGVRVK